MCSFICINMLMCPAHAYVSFHLHQHAYVLCPHADALTCLAQSDLIKIACCGSEFIGDLVKESAGLNHLSQTGFYMAKAAVAYYYTIYYVRQAATYMHVCNYNVCIL